MWRRGLSRLQPDHRPEGTTRGQKHFSTYYTCSTNKSDISYTIELVLICLFSLYQKSRGDSELQEIMRKQQEKIESAPWTVNQTVTWQQYLSSKPTNELRWRRFCHTVDQTSNSIYFLIVYLLLVLFVISVCTDLVVIYACSCWNTLVSL